MALVRIRKKTFLIVASIAILTSLMVYHVSEVFLLQTALLSEKEIIKEDIQRLNMGIANEFFRLNSVAGDWANWDDTYQYVQDNNTQYIESNLIFESFQELTLNLIIFINLEGEIVFSKTYDLASRDVIPIPLNYDTILKENDFSITEYDDPKSGLIKTEYGFLMVSYAPILKSSYEGPAQGVLIFGRFFDVTQIALLSETIGLPIDIVGINSPNMPEDFTKANKTLSEANEIVDIIIDETTVAGYIFLKDLNLNPVAIIRILENRSGYIQAKNSIAYLAVSIVLIDIILISLIMALLDKFVLARLTKLTKDVEKTTLNESSVHKIELKGDDELSSLAHKINHMLETINTSQAKLQDYTNNLEEKVAEKTKELNDAHNKIIQNERLAVIGQMASMVAHDLRNPLFGIKNATFILKRRENIKEDEAVKKILLLIDESLENANRIVNDLLDYSKEIKLEKSTTTLNSLLLSSLKETRLTRAVHLENLVDDSLKVNVDVYKMKRVFINLINNAVDAMPEGGTIKIESLVNESSISISFSDTGKGISQENINKLWKPLFTTKTKGIGLGLVICKRFIEAHNGTITVTSEEGKGTTFTITLPAISEYNIETN